MTPLTCKLIIPIGDMRRFDAIDVEALHHLSDVIVFPAKGPRPHTDEMSGSDLDGDKYFVTWYEDLDPLGNNEEAMDFTSPKKKLLDRPVAVSDMIQFVADYIKNDQLGIIANAHTVHADSQEEGIWFVQEKSRSLAGTQISLIFKLKSIFPGSMTVDHIAMLREVF